MNKMDINAVYENASHEVKELIELGYYSIEEICGMESKPFKPYIKRAPLRMDDNALKYYKNLRNRVYNYVHQYKNGRCGDSAVFIEESEYGVNYKHAYEMNVDVCEKEDEVVKSKKTIFNKLLSSSACLATFIFAVLIVVAAALYTVVNVLLFINPVLVFVFVLWIIIYAFVKACRDDICKDV